MFRCESHGYETIVFGAFDGVTSWTNNAYINLGPVHQELVGTHEERHLRLQKGTPWGGLLLLLALQADADPNAEERLVPLLDASRRTHEAYATYMSAAHVRDGLSQLDGNALYLDYWRAAAALADIFDAAAPALTILEYLFHLTMSPAALATATLASDHADLLAQSPDSRLSQLTEMLQRDPGLASTVARTVEGSNDVRPTQDALAAALTGNGLQTLTTAEQLTHAQRLMDEFNATSKTHRVHISDRSASTSLADQLDYQQYELLAVNRTAVALRIGAPPMGPDAPHPFTDFVMDDTALGAHVWAVALSNRVIQRQFVLDEPLQDERYWGLLAVDRREDPPFARLWPLPEPPIAVTDKFAHAGIQTVQMTTMSTLLDTYETTPFAASVPLFVLVDAPTLPFLRGLQAEDGTVGWVHAHSIGDLVVHLLVLTIDGPDPLHFVIARSEHTARATAQWLHSESGFRHDPRPDADVARHLPALAQHLTGTFWALENTPALRDNGPPSNYQG